MIMSDGADEPSLLLFRRPRRVVAACAPRQVLPALREAEEWVARGGCAAGFVAYEAAPGLDPAGCARRPRGWPLVFFGLFARAEPFVFPPDGREGTCALSAWRPTVPLRRYQRAVRRIHAYLRAGHTYQVNYTIRLRARFRGEPLALFRRLHRAQRGRYSAFIETPDFAVCSASPELAFALDGAALVSRPMKGTAPRGLTWEEDEALREGLRHSEKNRAENVMIVDMARNDLGRVAHKGTVRVPALYAVERYPTVFQMTSTVACRTAASLAEIFGAVFPCASITGAPKLRTMEIIRELEDSPRGVYTGCIGYLLPGRRALFSVAIRTVTIERRTGRAEYGVGGGIVWDSNAADEYRECRTKAALLAATPRDFELLETMRCERGRCFLLDRHLVRLRRSARYFGFAFDRRRLRREIERATSALPPAPHKLRVRLAAGGAVDVEAKPLPAGEQARPWRVAFAAAPIAPDDPFLYHKTTNRLVYERAAAARPDVDDVVLWNARGEVTESTIANLVIERAGARLTPPVACGLLPGTFRQQLLDRGDIREKVLTREDVRRADRIFLINSVRKWIPAVLVE